MGNPQVGAIKFSITAKCTGCYNDDLKIHATLLKLIVKLTASYNMKRIFWQNAPVTIPLLGHFTPTVYL